ncbi:MAG: preprotein translocase subunit YajC [Veillonellaceae bacterium]|nr:preprotein translocase subunit YajC [Veillonellaceae bacterium]
MSAMSPELITALAQYGPIVLMGVIFYFLLYRPQKKEQQRRNEMLNSLKKGDRIVTIGGVHGTITAITEKVVTLKISEKVEVDISRTAVASFQNEPKNGSKK